MNTCYQTQTAQQWKVSFPSCFFGPSCRSESREKKNLTALQFVTVSSSRCSRSPLPSSASKQEKVSLWCVKTSFLELRGWRLAVQGSAALSQLTKTHEINVTSMVFGGETSRRSVKVTLPSPLVPRRYGGSEMRWRMTVWQRCLRLHRLLHLCVYHLHVADPKRGSDNRRVMSPPPLRYDQEG